MNILRSFPVLVVVLGCCYMADAQEAVTQAKRLQAGEESQREHAIEELVRHQVSVREQLRLTLTESIQNHQDDARYMSPLHCAIVAVETWRVFEAEGELFSVIGYRLDTKSIPLGTDISGDYFYPAAKALVALRVDTKKVIDAIVRARSQYQVHLLTWVLVNRTGSVDEARRTLTPLASAGNIAEALKLLEHEVELPSALDARNN